MPHLRGEGLTIRILDRSAVKLDFDALGLGSTSTSAMLRALSHRSGLVLVTGPTGSGKSTTLYAALRHVSTETLNIVTIEDPVELELDGVNQIEIARQAGLDFAGTLRAVLRQDPDVVMVGEIRDGETARVAVQAALTGHLVLATLHANSAAGAIPRLIDMGIEPFLLASTVRGILAQRLVRRLCRDCHGRGRGGGAADPRCSSCGGCGYRGRLALTEFLSVTDAVANEIRKAASDRDIERAANLETLLEDGRTKAAAGLTDLAEVGSLLGVPA
jgi:type II secretory ATPase GspE/PulE/Tfp pilus assembly ATPase PilB-like protein